MGNTCYMNSVLSVLMNSPHFVSVLQKCEKTDSDKERDKDAVELLDSFYNLIELKGKVKDNSVGIIQPGGILRLMFKYLSHRKSSPLAPGRQNDAMECLSVFLDAFEESTKNEIKQKWQGGKIKRFIINEAESKVADMKEERQIAWNIIIPNSNQPVSLIDCIKNTYDDHKEIVNYKRDGDTEPKDYTIVRKIDTTPDMWIMSLARWDMMQNKIQTPIQIPVSINLNDNKYELRGIICHAGHTIPSGHYYSIVMRDLQTAIRINDDSVMKCPIPFPDIVQRHAYGMVYEKMG